MPKAPMKLAIFIYSLSGGGAERQTSYILSYCHNHNIDAHLILMNTIIKYEVPKEIPIHFLEQSESDENGTIKALKIPYLAYKYSRLLKKLQITHSVSLLTRPNYINLIAQKLTRHPFKVIVNELAFPSLQYSYPGFQSKFNKTLIKNLFKNADLIISNSEGNAKDLIDNFEVPSGIVSVVHNPIDLKKINAIAPVPDVFDPQNFNIITLGRLDVGKNHKMLIEAIAQLNHPRVRLYIFGVGDMQEPLEDLIQKLDVDQHVFLMGFDPNPYQYLKAADLFMFGSNHEGFPNVLLEAMACQLPILTTNCESGPNEIMELKTIKNDLMITDYGILVPVKNKDLMAKGIQYFLDHKTYAESCKTHGKRRILAFEKNNILKKYLDLIINTK
ncbi:glycosyltransferase [Winogradskyella rapida]|uniref:Glycosyltransferase n=1 Tax=Winogradskyella rapida TaxID=549701 RepID=A0ABW3KQE0_9FLAO